MRLLPLLIGLPLACAPASPEAATADDEYAAQVAALCHAEVTSGAISAFPYGAKGEAMQRWLDDHLTHSQAKALYYETVLQSPVHHQRQVLTDAAGEVGVAPCPLADYLDFLAKMPIEAMSDTDCVAACQSRNASLATEIALPRACAEGCGSVAP